MNYNLLMLIPPFRGPGAVTGVGITDDENYIKVDRMMRVEGLQRMYAVGDCVNFNGPKLGHMAVHQAEVAAANVALEISGREPIHSYDHEMMLVIDEGGGETIFLHKGLWVDAPALVKQGRFWTWAKRIHKKYWLAKHS
jgi:sulfide:quinone oxidoreductase